MPSRFTREVAIDSGELVGTGGVSSFESLPGANVGALLPVSAAGAAVGVASFTAGVGTSAKAACVKHVDANKAQMAIFE